MTPKEKAKELVDKLINKSVVIVDDIKYFHPRPYDLAKQCALIAVDEMIVQNGDVYLGMLGDKANQYYTRMNNYLFEVKKEIEKL